jgi:hypothetical protein
MNNPLVRSKFIRPYVTQSTISGINQSNLAKVLVLAPPVERQWEFSRRCSAIELRRTLLEGSLSLFDALFMTVQSNAFAAGPQSPGGP